MVSALLIAAAVTGSAGPVEVIWLLGTISVGVSMAWIVLGRWLPRRGPEDTDPRRTHPAAHPGEHPGEVPQPPAGTGTGPTAS